jgi:hypothetical protein
MDADTYHDLHVTIVRLEKMISHARFQDDRMGTIPPRSMANVLAEVADACATINDLIQAQDAKTLP